MAAQTLECDRCGTDIPLDDAVELYRERNKQMLKVLCPGCLEELGVPQGYEIRRDLSYRQH